jgi:hypothetical protein
MRIRTVKPEFWTNQDLISLSEFSRLMALALLNYCDDEGYFNASPVLIRGAVFPFESDLKRVESAIQDLHKIDYIRLGTTVDGKKFGFVVNFEKHQYIQRPKESAFKGLCEFRYYSDTCTIHVSDVYQRERKGMERNGMERKGTEGPPIPAVLDSEEFRQAWSKWQQQRKQQKQKPYTPIGAETQLKKLAEWGKERAVAAIEHSIAQGYQGIYEGTQNGHAKSKQDLFKAGANLSDFDSCQVPPG